jgi:hypothetical protein
MSCTLASVSTLVCTLAVPVALPAERLCACRVLNPHALTSLSSVLLTALVAGLNGSESTGDASLRVAVDTAARAARA